MNIGSEYTKIVSGKKKKIKSLIEGSLFCRFFIWLAELVFLQMRFSKTSQLLSSYSSIGKKYTHSRTRILASKLWFKPDRRLLFKNKVQRSIENSIFYKVFLKSTNYLLAIKGRVYGVVLFIYGFCTSSVGLIKTFLLPTTTSDYFLLWQGVVIVVVGIFLLAVKKDMGTLIADGKFTGLLILKVIAIDRDKVVRKPIEDNSVVPMLVGVLLGITSLILQPVYVILAFFAFVYVSLVFSIPEFGVLVAVATVPFMPTMLICAEIILLFTAFFFKVIRGKRSVHFGPLDIAIIFFGIFLILGGIFSASVSTSLPTVCVFICFMVSYFLVVNLVKTMDFLKKILKYLSLSLLVCAVIGIWQNFFGVANTKWTDVDMFSTIETRVISTFDNPNVFGEYLIMMLPMVMSLFLIENGFKNRSFFMTAFASGALALIFTWSRGAWLGFIFAMLIYLIVVNRKSIAVYFVGIAALPFAYPFFPESIKSRIESIGNMADTSTSYRVHIWEAVWDMLHDWWLTGIGVGVGAFEKIYPSYSLAGIETAPHSHNLFFQIFLELGIFGFFSFILVVFFAISKCCTYLIHGTQRDVKLISTAALVGVLAILLQGLTDFVWYNYRVFLLFWVVLSVMSVTLDIAKREDGRTDDVESYLMGGQNGKAEIKIQI